jgi:hypothetical protein
MLDTLQIETLRFVVTYCSIKNHRSWKNRPCNFFFSFCSYAKRFHSSFFPFWGNAFLIVGINGGFCMNNKKCENRRKFFFLVFPPRKKAESLLLKTYFWDTKNGWSKLVLQIKFQTKEFVFFLCNLLNYNSEN